MLDPETLIDLSAIDRALPDEALSPPPSPPIANLPEADEANQDIHPAAGARGAGDHQAAPSPDQGDGPGRNLSVAWRRDASTLRARLTTGARLYQPSRGEDRGPGVIAARRCGGSGARGWATAPAQASQRAERSPCRSCRRAPSRWPATRIHSRTSTSSGERRWSPGTVRPRGEGPLDADVGSRAFDVPVDGPARDTGRSPPGLRRLNPGLTDYAAVAGAGRRSSGPRAGPSRRESAARSPRGPRQLCWLAQPAPINNRGVG
jgi:hypothetical protein